VTQVEGSAGGGLVPWALIGGLGTDGATRRNGICDVCLDGGFCTALRGLSIDVDNRWEFRWRASDSTQAR